MKVINKQLLECWNNNPKNTRNIYLFEYFQWWGKQLSWISDKNSSISNKLTRFNNHFSRLFRVLTNTDPWSLHQPNKCQSWSIFEMVAYIISYSNNFAILKSFGICQADWAWFVIKELKTWMYCCISNNCKLS